MCRQIRSVSRAPILVLSTQSKPEMVVQALDDGADDYLLKPMQGAVLIAHLKKLARRSQRNIGGNNPSAATFSFPVKVLLQRICPVQIQASWIKISEIFHAKTQGG
jgi:OmpR family two-component system response regulator YxdJ